MVSSDAKRLGALAAHLGSSATSRYRGELETHASIGMDALAGDVAFQLLDMLGLLLDDGFDQIAD
jgi:hypothetical protein